MSHRFNHGTYVVTGATRGIGRAIALTLAEQGTELILLARDKKKLAQMEQEIKGKNPRSNAWSIACDLADRKAIARAVGDIRKRSQSLSGIIHVAGYARPGYFHELPGDEFEKAMRTDYLGAVYLTQGLVDKVESGGLISVTSSVVGFMGVFGYTSYAGPKWALIGFAESLRQELIARKIQVAVLCPPDTETPGYAEENRTKPYETVAISESAKLMQPEAVARKFFKGIARGKFLITCNGESTMLYRLKGIWPSLVFWIMKGMIKKAQRNKLKFPR